MEVYVDFLSKHDGHKRVYWQILLCYREQMRKSANQLLKGG